MNISTPFSAITAYESKNNSGTTADGIVIELRVRNHPGVMSHITGLFARRAFNLEAILCVPIGDGSESRMLLLVDNTPRLDQIERQLAKLHDVLSVHQRNDLPPCLFAEIADKTAPQEQS